MNIHLVSHFSLVHPQRIDKHSMPRLFILFCIGIGHSASNFEIASWHKNLFHSVRFSLSRSARRGRCFKACRHYQSEDQRAKNNSFHFKYSVKHNEPGSTCPAHLKYINPGSEIQSRYVLATTDPAARQVWRRSSSRNRRSWPERSDRWPALHQWRSRRWRRRTICP